MLYQVDYIVCDISTKMHAIVDYAALKTRGHKWHSSHSTRQNHTNNCHFHATYRKIWLKLQNIHFSVVKGPSRPLECSASKSVHYLFQNSLHIFTNLFEMTSPSHKFCKENENSVRETSQIYLLDYYFQSINFISTFIC